MPKSILKQPKGKTNENSFTSRGPDNSGPGLRKRGDNQWWIAQSLPTWCYAAGCGGLLLYRLPRKSLLRTAGLLHFCPPWMPKLQSIEERLLARIEGTNHQGCWLLSACSGGKRYPKIWLGHRREYTHRAAYTIWVGPLKPGLLICHRCSIKHCICPTHLFQGTYSDNLRQWYEEGRQKARGFTSC